jgi:hypothetical protein
MILSLARDFVLIAPLCVILPTRLGVVGPLYSAPIADVICLVITVVVVAVTFKKMGIISSKENDSCQAYVSAEPEA